MIITIGRYALLLWLFLGTTAVQADSLDVGVGWSLIDMADNQSIETGWDLQIGYEFLQSEDWSAGLQLQLTDSLTSDGTNDYAGGIQYSATGLYLMARPKNSWLHAKAGVVQGDYYNLTGKVDRSGYGAGIGVVMGSGGLTLHLLDYQHIVFDNDSFNLYTISLLVMY